MNTGFHHIPAESIIGSVPVHGAHALVRDDETNQYRTLKLGIWMYFLLLIFEGALRKWFLPGLATPLLVVRDPLALWLVIMTWKHGLLQPNIYLIGTVLIGFTSFFTALFLGHGSLPVALYGARILLLQFPLIFVIGRIFSREDVLKMGRVTLWIAIPMAVLIALQFYSPQSAWVNRGVGGDTEGAGFSGALGYFRPPGTFSFTNGTTFFFSLVTVFVFYFLLNPRGINKLLLATSAIALLMAIPLSISRALFFQVGVTLIFILIATFRKPKYLGRMIIGGIGAFIILAALNQASFFETATAAFTSRFESASESEGGLEGTLVHRYLGGMIHALEKTADMPFFGYGIGMGTNVGSMLLAGGRSFLIAEEEWARNIGELGPLLGLTIIFFRIGLSVKVTWAGYCKMQEGDLLPWLLLSFGLIVIPQGQWAQPTALGFCVLIAGLIVASLRAPRREEVYNKEQ